MDLRCQVAPHKPGLLRVVCVQNPYQPSILGALSALLGKCKKRMSDTLNKYREKKQASAKQGRNRIIAIGVIVATLPFYCVGLVAYFLAPNNPLAAPTATPTATTVPTEATSTGGDQDPATATPTLTLIPTNTLVPTATQPLGVPITDTPRVTATLTATATPTLTATPAATNTPVDTATPVPTNTPEITSTPLPFSN